MDFEQLLDEEWRPVVECEKEYLVSNYGRVKSLPRNGTLGGIMSQINLSGYQRVILRKNNKRFNAGVHRLVAQAFIPNPENKPTVNHIDGNKLNNHVNNLEWATWQEQLKHSFEHNLRDKQCAIQRGCELISRLNTGNIIKFKSCKELSEYLGYTRGWVSSQLRKHGNPFEYKDYYIYVYNRGDIDGL